jgi:hypothetical protein
MRAFAICGALLLLPGSAAAQLVERLRLQGGYTHLNQNSPPDDEWVGAVPELAYLWAHPRYDLRLTYSLTIAAHTTIAAEISNRVGLASDFTLSKRTVLLLSAEAAQTSVENELVARPAQAATLAALPPPNTRFLTFNLSQGITYEVSPVTRFNEGVTATETRTLTGPVDFDNLFTTAVLGIERAWKKDAIGVDFRGGYARTHAEPQPVQQFFNVGLAPRWRHDINASLTASVSTGASLVFSTDDNTKPKVSPYIEASLFYFWQEATFELVYTTGLVPNQLTAQLLQADSITLHANAPLSNRHHILGGASVGYTHGHIVDLRRDVVNPAPDYNQVAADVGVTWQVSNVVGLFARYQFLDLVTDENAAGVATPPTLRNAVIVGVQLSSRDEGAPVVTRFPQRVDRGDTPAPAPKKE